MTPLDFLATARDGLIVGAEFAYMYTTSKLASGIEKLKTIGTEIKDFGEMLSSVLSDYTEDLIILIAHPIEGPKELYKDSSLEKVVTAARSALSEYSNKVATTAHLALSDYSNPNLSPHAFPTV